jgi:hypothetical protein
VPSDFIEEKFLTHNTTRDPLHVPVSIQIVLLREMTSQDLAQVFENVFLPQIQKAQGGSKTGSGTAALQSFTKLFAELDKKNWEKGSTLQISRYPKRTQYYFIL